MINFNTTMNFTKRVKINYNSNLFKQQIMSGALLRFLSILEKVLIVIAIAAFIPATIVVFIINSPSMSDANLVSAYMTARQQIQSPFIVDYKRNSKGETLCSFREALLNNDYCFNRADHGNYSVTSGTPKSCSGRYIASSYTYCPGLNITQIKNKFVFSAQIPQFVHSEQSLPIFKIEPNSSNSLDTTSPIITYFRYIPDGKKSECLAIKNSLRQNLQEQSNELVQPYKSSLLFLWIVLLIVGSFMVGSLAINQLCSKWNLRPYIVMNYLYFNVILMMINALGISFYEETKVLKAQITTLSACFMDPIRNSLQLATTVDFGINIQFVFFLGVVCFFIALCIGGEIAIRILQIKTYSSRQEYTQQGYQLQAI